VGTLKEWDCRVINQGWRILCEENVIIQIDGLDESLILG
jgi:hypothetical protein